MKKYPEVNDFLVSTKKLKKFDKAKSFWKVVKVDLCGHDYESLDDEIGLFPELIARFREQYYTIFYGRGPTVCL